MATATLIEAIESQTNASSYAFSAYSPAGAGEVLAILGRVTATASSLTCSDTGQGLTWTRQQDVTQGSHKLAVFTAVTASATALTPAVDSGADAGTGAELVLYKVLDADTTTPHVQSTNGTAAAGGTPALTFGASIDSANAVIVFLANVTNPAGVTEPASFTEDHDSGHINPTSGGEAAHRNSGQTGTTVTWGSTTPSNAAMVGIEIATAAAAASISFEVGQIAF